VYNKTTTRSEGYLIYIKNIFSEFLYSESTTTCVSLSTTGNPASPQLLQANQWLVLSDVTKKSVCIATDAMKCKQQYELILGSKITSVLGFLFDIKMGPFFLE